MAELPGYVLTVPAVVGNLAIWAPPSMGSAAQTVFRPLGGCPIDEAVSELVGINLFSEETDEDCRAWYLGAAQTAFTGARIVVDVFTVADAPTWCEIGLLKGTPVLCNGPSSLTLVKAADVTATWGAPGPQYTDLAAIGVSVGEHLWLAWSIKKGVPALPSLRACVPDAIMSGVFVHRAATRLTTMAGALAFDRVASGTRGIDAVVGFS
jgi:hypothetical protein